MTLDPIRDASHEEPVTVTIGNAVRGLDGSSLRSRGHQFHYWTGARVTSMEFEIVQSITTSAFPGEQVIPHGGTATDLDGDRDVDVACVNSFADRGNIFLNDGTGDLLEGMDNDDDLDLSSWMSSMIR